MLNLVTLAKHVRKFNQNWENLLLKLFSRCIYLNIFLTKLL